MRRCVEGVLNSATLVVDDAATGCVRDRLTLDPGIQQLDVYLAELARWNQRFDLTAARGSEELVDLFVADAVVLAATSSEVQDWVDIGTGPGAPGIPLLLLSPELSLTLVEPRSKRTAFLRTVLGVLGLDQVHVRRERSDALFAGSHDVAVSRATLAPPEWLAEGARIATNAVWVLLARDEAPTLPGWQADIDLRYEWPLTRVARRAVRFVPDRQKSP